MGKKGILMLAVLGIVAFSQNVLGQELKTNPLWAKIDQLSSEVESKCIAWRRDFHQNPELSNREFRTAKKVAEHLLSLGIDVKTEVAHTGVVGVLRGEAVISRKEPYPRMCICNDDHSSFSFNRIFTASTSSAVMSSLSFNNP